MNTNAQEVGAKLILAGVFILGLIVAIYFGIIISDARYFNIAGIAFVSLAVLWVVIARDRWWIPFIVAISMGGAFYVGFKLYVHEAMLALCLMPLIANIALRKESALIQRINIPPSVILLTGYLFLHWFICLMYNQVNGYGGTGQVSRQYMNAGWPFILFLAFYLFGKTQYLKTALILMYVTYGIRFVAGIYFYFQYGGMEDDIFMEEKSLVYIPIINYIPKVGNAADLRESAIYLGALSIGFFSASRSGWYKSFNFLVFIACLVGCLFGGGRAALLIFIILIFCWNVIYRNMLFLCLSGLLVLSSLTYINLDPYSIEALPKKMQRAVSGLVFTEDNLAIKREISSSDRFHALLRKQGWERFIEDEVSMFFGHGIRPFDVAAWNDLTRDNVTKKAEQAKLTGRYEKGFWTVLATFGAVGFALYLNILRLLLWNPIKSLWRNKIKDTEHIFYFLAAFSIFSWLITMFFTGSFPSEEIMLGLFALVAYEDSRKKKLAEKNETTS